MTSFILTLVSIEIEGKKNVIKGIKNRNIYLTVQDWHKPLSPPLTKRPKSMRNKKQIRKTIFLDFRSTP